MKKEIPDYLEVCFKCAYPKYDRYYWETANVGDTVYISGNTSKDGTLIPCSYGPHTIRNVILRTLLSGGNGKTFNHHEDSLLCLKKENEHG